MIRRYPIGFLFIVSLMLVLLILSGRRTLIRAITKNKVAHYYQTNTENDVEEVEDSTTPSPRTPAQLADTGLATTSTVTPNDDAFSSTTFLSFRLPQRRFYRRLWMWLTAIIPSLSACGLFILWYLKREARVADDVINRLHRGELDARLPERTIAGYGGLVTSFNRMANDIETLVMKLRKGEATRAELLQEMAHDVRTPLSALQLLHDFMLNSVNRHTDPATTKTLLKAQAEVKYLQHIIEGFVVIAQIEESGFRGNPSPISVYDTIMAETLPLQDLPDKLHIQWEVINQLPNEETITVDPLLFSRAIRNVLNNAVHFTATKISVLLEVASDQSLRMIVRDNGKGFSPEGLKTYGERKKLRIVDPAVPSHVSVGLGTVITKKIITSLGGTVEPRNRVDQSGAEIVIVLPKTLRTRQRQAA